jgi:hypothetical protein
VPPFKVKPLVVAVLLALAELAGNKIR